MKNDSHLAIFSCKEIPNYTINGEIIGYGAKICACCGGNEITMDNFQNLNGKEYFQVGYLSGYFMNLILKFSI
jgi:hypothetical protein